MIPPAKTTHGRPPTRLRARTPAVQVDLGTRWQPVTAWQSVTLHGGTKGPLRVEVLHRRVWLWDGELVTSALTKVELKPEDQSIMNPSTIHIVARIVAKPDAVAQLRVVLEKLLEPTRQEAGCRRYTLLQNRHDPTDFTFVEEWASDAAIDAHLQTSHIRAAFAQAQGLLAAEPDIRQYELVG